MAEEKKYILLDNIIKKIIKEPGEGYVCDYGCGSNGTFLNILSKYPEVSINTYLAVDREQDAIEATQDMASNNEQILNDIHVCTTDNLDLSTYSQKFDYVIMHELLHEVEPHKVLENVFRLLKPRGKILLGDFCFSLVYESNHVFWSNDWLRRLFDSRIFTVRTKQYSYKGNKSFFAEIILKDKKYFPDSSELLSRVKSIYTDMLTH